MNTQPTDLIFANMTVQLPFIYLVTYAAVHGSLVLGILLTVLGAANLWKGASKNDRARRKKGRTQFYLGLLFVAIYLFATRFSFL